MSTMSDERRSVTDRMPLCVRFASGARNLRSCEQTERRNSGGARRGLTCIGEGGRINNQCAFAGVGVGPDPFQHWHAELRLL